MFLRKLLNYLHLNNSNLSVFQSSLIMDDLHNNAVEEGCQEGRRGGNDEPMDDVNPFLDAVEEGWQDSRRDGKSPLLVAFHNGRNISVRVTTGSILLEDAATAKLSHKMRGLGRMRQRVKLD